MCATPAFAARTTSRVRLSELIPEVSGCPYCVTVVVEVLDDNDEVIYPLAFQVTDPDSVRELYAPGRVVNVQIAAFAEEIRTWPGDTDFACSKDEVQLGVESLIPTGLFTEPRRRLLPLRRQSKRGFGGSVAFALITGHVGESHERVNPITGEGFVEMLVHSYGGEYTLVASQEEMRTAPAVGAVVQAATWLVGDIDVGAA